MFEVVQPTLQDVLRDALLGKLQLPDFQRGWVWEEDGIASLIASLARSFPVGENPDSPARVDLRSKLTRLLSVLKTEWHPGSLGSPHSYASLPERSPPFRDQCSRRAPTRRRLDMRLPVLAQLETR
jgi:hypothetical protein